MKTRIVLTVMTIVVLVVTGCAGQPGIQTIQISTYNGVFADFGTMAIDESYGSLAKFGYNEFQTKQMLMAVDIPFSQNNRPALFGANGLLSGKLSLPFVIPYNHDGSITLFWLPDMQVRFMPMASVR